MRGSDTQHCLSKDGSTGMVSQYLLKLLRRKPNGKKKKKVNGSQASISEPRTSISECHAELNAGSSLARRQVHQGTYPGGLTVAQSQDSFYREPTRWSDVRAANIGTLTAWKSGSDREKQKRKRKHDFNHIWQKMRETTNSKALKRIQYI